MSKIAFIGTGNMGAALAVGVCKAINPADVTVYDHNRYKTEKISRQTGCKIGENRRQAVNGARYIVLGMKPAVLRKSLQDIIPAIKENVERAEKQVVISMAAGISISDIEEVLNGRGLNLPIIRMLPNTPCEIGSGLIIYGANGLCDESICGEVEKMFAPCGIIEKMGEKMIDAASAISGCTPAFVYMFIDALADGAVRCGVPRAKAIEYASRVVKGSAEMVLQTGRHPDRLKDAVCSPAGSTIEGVTVLEEGSFRFLASDAVYKANLKNGSLGKK